MRTERVAWAGAGGDEVGGVLRVPASAAPLAGVLWVHGDAGLDGAADEAARRLADAGFAVLAPDLWSREGAPGDPGALPDRRALLDLAAGLARLAADGAVDGDRIAAAGAGTGGTRALLLACHADGLAAVVSAGGPVVYPELSAARPMQPLEMTLNLSAPLLALFGADDPAVPPEHVERLRATLAQFARPLDVHVLPGRGAGLLAAEAAEAAAAAWEIALEFLRRALADDPA